MLVVLFIIYACIEKDLKKKVRLCNLLLLIVSFAWNVLDLAIIPYNIGIIVRLIINIGILSGAIVNIMKLDNAKFHWIWMAVWMILASLGWLLLIIPNIGSIPFEVVLVDVSYIVMTF